MRPSSPPARSWLGSRGPYPDIQARRLPDRHPRSQPRHPPAAFTTPPRGRKKKCHTAHASSGETGQIGFNGFEIVGAAISQIPFSNGTRKFALEFSFHAVYAAAPPTSGGRFRYTARRPVERGARVYQNGAVEGTSFCSNVLAGPTSPARTERTTHSFSSNSRLIRSRPRPPARSWARSRDMDRVRKPRRPGSSTTAGRQAAVNGAPHPNIAYDKSPGTSFRRHRRQNTSGPVRTVNGDRPIATTGS